MKRRFIPLLILVLLFSVTVSWAAPKKLEIVWMGWPKAKVMELIADFEKENPNIKIDIQLIPFSQLFQTLEVRLLSGGKPDVYIVDGPLTPSYAARGYLLPLDEYFSADELGAFFDASLVTARYNNKLYSIPYATSSAGLFYNRDIFKEYGVACPSKKADERLTWEEVAKIAQQLTIDENQDGQIDIWGLVIEQVDRPYQLLPLAQSNGAKAISADGLRTDGYITSPEFIEAATFYWRLFNDWKVSPQGLNDSAKSREYFGNGKAVNGIYRGLRHLII
jgi:ABC-type glycerol-3-phosphate transport system substrate-binding protein